MPVNIFCEYNYHLVMWIINVIPKKVSCIVDEPLEECCKGWLFKGIKDYLLDNY